MAEKKRLKMKPPNRDWWTIEEWLNEFGIKYDYTNKYSKRHIQRCCAGDVIIVKGQPYRCSLPDGWVSEKLPIGGRGIWIIRKKD